MIYVLFQMYEEARFINHTQKIGPKYLPIMNPEHINQQAIRWVSCANAEPLRDPFEYSTLNDYI